MRDYFRAKTWFITLLMFVFAFGLSLGIVYYEFGSRQNIKISNASPTNNVTGWAWSSNIGWVSFNCTNDSPACGSSNYGVSIDLTTGHFSGYAWSPNVGWISFNETGAPDYAFNGSCATPGSCTAAANCTACYNWTDSKVYGWAKILAMGDTGWIKFNDAWSNGVSIDQLNGNFSGWAWNANVDKSGIGWLSLGCSNDSPACGSSNYKVNADINRPPSATALTAPNWSFSQAGQLGALKAKIGWTFSDPDAGQTEYAYQIIVNTSNSITSAVPVLNTGKCTGYLTPSPNCKIGIGVDEFFIDSAIALNYNTPYYWWVKVWDNYGTPKESPFAQYNSAQDTPLEANDGQPLTFTTYKHKMPIASPTCFPEKPSRGEKVKCTANSQRFFSAPANPASPVDCNNTICSWLWTIPPNASFDNPDGGATSTPIIIFNSAGSNDVKLRVTDVTDTGNEPYYIEFTVNINVNAQLPKWQEVKPE